MSRSIAVVTLLLALLAPARGAAQLSLGARAGYAHAVGDVGGALSMQDWLGGQIPIQLDATYRVRPNLALGVYFSWGFGRTAGDAGRLCDAPGADCSASVRRLGVQLVRSLSPVRGVVPWLGAGAGYEWNMLSATQSTGRARAKVTGFEYLNLQAGGDWPVAARLSVGPYVMISMGQYGQGELGGADGEVEDRSFHAWLGIGVRGRYNL